MSGFLVFTLLVLGQWPAASASPQQKGNSQCAQWCAANFANPGASCTSLAAHGSGPCYQCGPLKTISTEMLCAGACSDTSSDGTNCGACGVVCPSGSSCQSGACKCPGGLSLCNGACPDLSSDDNNCGECGNVCPVGSSCQSGACKCPGGLSLCNGACPDLLSDNNNCGTCGNVCPLGSSCQSGACECPGGLSLCNGACPDLSSDNNNCGTCGTVCPAGSSCQSGACECPGGLSLCNGACSDLLTDSNNCGTCGNMCPAGSSCQSGACECPGGVSLCNGACPDFSSDNNNCGTCGNMCSPGGTCIQGACSAQSFYLQVVSTGSDGAEANGQCAFYEPAEANAVEFAGSSGNTQTSKPPIQFTIDPTTGELSGGGLIVGLGAHCYDFGFCEDFPRGYPASAYSGPNPTYTPMKCTYDGTDGGAVSCVASVKSSFQQSSETLQYPGLQQQGDFGVAGISGQEAIFYVTQDENMGVSFKGVWNINECAA